MLKRATISDLKPDSIPLKNSQKGSFFVPKVLYENRYCNQKDFSIIVCGGQNKNSEVVDDVYELRGPNFESFKLPSLLEARRDCRIALINSDIFVVGGCSNHRRDLYSVEMFSKNRNTWSNLTNLCSKRTGFLVSSFKQNLYIIGDDQSDDSYSFRSCIVYNIKRN